MAQVVVDGLMTNYVSVGKGKTVVMLHGWGDTSSTFAGLTAELSKKYKVIAVDLPGFGKTQAPGQAWTLDDYAAFVGTFLNKISVKPYTLVGHSNGGAIAIRALSSHVISTDRLVLLASAGIRGQYNGRNKVLRMVAKTGKLLTKPLPRSVQKRLRTKMYQTVGSDMLVAEHLQETFKNIVSDDVRAEAASIQVKTLLVYGNNDSATPPSYGHMLKDQLPHGTLHIIKDAGHFVHHDSQLQVTDYIMEFLS